MEKLFELTFQDQTLNPQVGTFTDASQATGTFTLEDGEYYLTNADTKGFYAYAPIAIQPDSETDNKVTVEFDLKVVTASVNTHTIIGTYAGVDGSGIPTGAKITLQYNAGDIELVLGSGATATLIAAADVVVDQWYHFRIDCTLTAMLESAYEIKIDGVLIATVTGATTDYELGIISVLGTDQHACDECGIKNIRLITDDDYFVGRTALNQAFKDVKGYVDTHCMDLTSTQTAAGDKTFSGTTTTHDVIPATTDTYDLGSSTKEYNNAYIKALTVNGTAAGDILTHNASEFASVNSLAAVATSGSYNDLSNKPTIPTVNNATLTIQKNGTTIDTFTANSSTNKTVDITVPTVNNATLTIQKNGTTVKTFTANASSNVTANITVPTNTNQLTNGAGFITANYAVPRAGGAVMSGGDLARTVDNGGFNICGGTTWTNSGSLLLNGGGRGDYLTGAVVIHTHRDATSRNMHIYPNGTWTWEGNAVQLTSDARLKQQISEIDDKLLDAWEDVEPSQFKYNDAVDQKGDNARLHTGFVVQQIDSACKSHGVDISAYGLYCHEEYPERTEEVEVEQKDGTIKKETRVIEEASEHYSLRYTEALIVECKYLRRCIARLTARIEQLEKERETGK